MMGRLATAAVWVVKGRWKSVAVVLMLFFLVVWLFWPRGQNRQKEEAVVFIGGSQGPDRCGDVVFVHGLGGDARTTWQGTNPQFFWPQKLGEKFPNVGVWSVDYNAAPTEWLGTTMPIADRSKNMLETLLLKGLGKKPIVFIGHSLGGIVIKKMLQDANILDHAEWQELADNTKGVMFLATPHTGSSYADYVRGLSEMIPAAKLTLTTQELIANDSTLRDLNGWYRNRAPKLGITTVVLYEGNKVPRLSRFIVDESSSDPGIKDVVPIRVAADHQTICKPTGSEGLVYLETVKFVTQTLLAVPTPDSISFKAFIATFNDARGDAAKLEAFKKDHVGRLVTWSAVILDAVPDNKDEPAYWISATSEPTRTRDQAYARCSPEHFELSIRKGTVVELEGVIAESTNADGASLRDCKIIKRLEDPSK